MILGIDPGLNGALAFYDPAIDLLSVHDTPTITVKNGAGKDRQKLNGAAAAALMRNYKPTFAVIEAVHSMPKQGVASAFTFGLVTGRLIGMLDAFAITYVYAEPAVWKRYFKATADKNSSRLRATEWLPHHASLWARKKDDGRAEAALLALYGHRVYGGKAL